MSFGTITYALIQIRFTSADDSWVAFNSVFSYIILVSLLIQLLMLAFQCLIYFKLRKFQQSLSLAQSQENSNAKLTFFHAQFKQNYRSLLNELKESDNQYCLQFYSIFLLRRIVQSFIIIFGQEQPEFQISLSCIISFAYILYLCKFKPLKDKLELIVLIINETWIFFLFLQHSIYITQDPDKCEDFAFVVVLFTFLIIIGNYLLALSIILYNFYIYLKLRKLKVKGENREELQECKQDEKDMKRLDQTSVNAQNQTALDIINSETFRHKIGDSNLENSSKKIEIFFQQKEELMQEKQQDYQKAVVEEIVKQQNEKQPVIKLKKFMQLQDQKTIQKDSLQIRKTQPEKLEALDSMEFLKVESDNFISFESEKFSLFGSLSSLQLENQITPQIQNDIRVESQDEKSVQIQSMEFLQIESRKFVQNNNKSQSQQRERNILQLEKNNNPQFQQNQNLEAQNVKEAQLEDIESHQQENQKIFLKRKQTKQEKNYKLDNKDFVRLESASFYKEEKDKNTQSGNDKKAEQKNQKQIQLKNEQKSSLQSDKFSQIGSVDIVKLESGNFISFKNEKKSQVNSEDNLQQEVNNRQQQKMNKNIKPNCESILY